MTKVIAGGYACVAHLRAIAEWPRHAQTGLARRNSQMFDFWKKSEKNERFSLVVLGVCLIVLVTLVATRL